MELRGVKVRRLFTVDGVFRTRGHPDTHTAFAFQDVDEVRDPLGGILATTMMEAD